MMNDVRRLTGSCVTLVGASRIGLTKKRSLLLVTVLMALLMQSCARTPAKSPSEIQLLGHTPDPTPLGYWLKHNRFTVVLFVSEKCPCVRAHAARVRALATKYAPQRVQFLAVDPEFDATPETAHSLRQVLGWDFPILLDPKGALADRVDAEYAGHAVVFDAAGQVHYRGGIDSDRKQIHDDATPYLESALDDLIADRAVAVAKTEALGCVLRRDES